MASEPVLLIGKLPKASAEHADRIAVYLASGDDVHAEYPLSPDGEIKIALDRQEALAATKLELVVGPSGVGKSLAGVPDLQRVPIDARQLGKAGHEVHVPLEKIKLSSEILERWWGWCEWYCVSGQIIGHDGCPVPFAEVTVYSVDFLLAKTPRRTVLADATGHFTACFNWCECAYCCWPCWPNWWWCWPWWWEWDILHLLEQIEEAIPRVPVGPGPVENIRLAVGRPEGTALMRGEAFSTARKAAEPFQADEARTALIRRKLANPAIQRLFPWWWWCCDDPSICFTVKQGGTTVLQENPATDTRWCFEEGQSVTLVAGPAAVTTCQPPPPPDDGFLWTRVGSTTVNAIHEGYADGNTGHANSDLAFWADLDIYGEFAAGVGYYQVNAQQWVGDPARGGTLPALPLPAPITPDLYNTVVIWHRTTTNAVTFDQVKMGPFNHGGLTGLYATQEQRDSAAAPWPPLPAHNPGDVVVWAYNGRKLYADASSLIGGALNGGVKLTVDAYDAAFATIPLVANPDDHLTLEIDDTSTLTTAHINSVHVFDADNSTVNSTGTGNCPAYEIHPGGYVVLNVTVKDDHEHIDHYVVSPEFGHANIGTTVPGERDYQPAAMFPGAPYKAPDTGQKAFGGGTEDIYFYPDESCCYDFRLYAAKRVTNGSGSPGPYTGDFWTVLIKIV